MVPKSVPRETEQNGLPRVVGATGVIWRSPVQFKKTILAVSTAVIFTGGVAAFALPASAHVVCNQAGDCWSTHANVRYPRDLQIRRYNDRYADQNYRERRWHNNHRTWREENHDRDRGAYRNGVWFQF